VALARFSYLMGWTLGRKDHGLEEVTMEGWIDDLAITLAKTSPPLATKARRWTGTRGERRA